MSENKPNAKDGQHIPKIIIGIAQLLQALSPKLTTLFAANYLQHPSNTKYLKEKWLWIKTANNILFGFQL